jgi:hypothetical protein
MRLVDFLVALSNLIKPQSYLQALITTHKGYPSTNKQTNKQPPSTTIPSNEVMWPLVAQRVDDFLLWMEEITHIFGGA